VALRRLESELGSGEAKEILDELQSENSEVKPKRPVSDRAGAAIDQPGDPSPAPAPAPKR
jgi:hypothetical protein